MGKKYLVQYWVQDAGRGPAWRTVLDGKVSLKLDVKGGRDVDYGQFVVGVFIADDTKQSIAVSGMRNEEYVLGKSQVNAIQLRMID